MTNQTGALSSSGTTAAAIGGARAAHAAGAARSLLHEVRSNWRVNLPLLLLPAVLVAYALMPGPGRAALYLLVDVVCLSGMVLTQRHRPRAQSAMWFAVAASMSLSMLGDVAMFGPILLHGHQDTVPPLTTAAYLASYFACGVAMAMFVRRTGATTRGDILDASVFAVGILAVAWPLLSPLAPVAQVSPNADLATHLTLTLQSMAYPLSSMLVLCAGLLAATSGAWRVPAVRGLIGAAALGFLATAVLGAAASRGAYTPGSLYDAGWLPVYLLTLRTALAEHRHPILSAAPTDTLRDTDLVTDRASAVHRRSLALSETQVAGSRVRVISSSRIVALTASLAAAPLCDVAFDYSRRDDVLFLLLTSAAVCLVGFRLAGLMSYIRSQADQMRTRALHDELTGLPNREHLRTACITALRSAGHHALVFVDLDDFKTVNDTRGHAVGDRLLVAVAARLTLVARHGDLVARLGGDEFAVLIAGSSDDAHTEAETAAERFIHALSDTPVELDGQLYSIAASAGVTLLAAEPGAVLEQVYQDALAEADIAMYAAKRSGGGRGRHYEVSLREDLPGGHQLGDDLREALATDAITVAYQPVVTTARGNAVAMEALARWHHPTRGPLSPATFLPIALESGTLPQLDLLVLRKAVAAAAGWRTVPGCEDVRVHVNFSPATLGRPDLVERVAEQLELSRLPGEALVIEITEQSLIERRDQVAGRLRALRRIGVGLVLDDFGTGYSSLSYLDSFDVDTLKLDRSFIEAGTADGTSTPLLRAVLQLAATLGLTVISEGVETMAQHDTLAALSCPLTQGHLHSPAIELDHALLWLRKNNAPDAVRPGAA